MNTDLVEVRVASAADIGLVRELWAEYWAALGLPDQFQGFGVELTALPGLYASPRGSLLIATYKHEVAGTAAFRPLSDDACEAKRMYVRPQFRGLGVGWALLNRLKDDAVRVGYRRMFADTLPSMTDALALYRRAGFTEVDPYSSEPTPGAVYLRLDL